MITIYRCPCCKCQLYNEDGRLFCRNGWCRWPDSNDGVFVEDLESAYRLLTNKFETWKSEQEEE